MKPLTSLKTVLFTLSFLFIQTMMNAQQSLTGKIAAITTITPKKGYEKDIMEAAQYIQKQASTEDGCMLFSVNTQKDATQTVVMFEIFKDQDALDHHKKQPHTLHFADLLKGKFDKNDVVFLNNTKTLHH